MSYTYIYIGCTYIYNIRCQFTYVYDIGTYTGKPYRHNRYTSLKKETPHSYACNTSNLLAYGQMGSPKGDIRKDYNLQWRIQAAPFCIYRKIGEPKRANLQIVFVPGTACPIRESYFCEGHPVPGPLIKSLIQTLQIALRHLGQYNKNI